MNNPGEASGYFDPPPDALNDFGCRDALFVRNFEPGWQTRSIRPSGLTLSIDFGADGVNPRNDSMLPEPVRRRHLLVNNDFVDVSTGANHLHPFFKAHHRATFVLLDSFVRQYTNRQVITKLPRPFQELDMPIVE